MTGGNTSFTTNNVMCRTMELRIEASVSSTALDNLEQTLQDVGSNLEIVIADRQKNLVELKKQKNNISSIIIMSLHSL
jgi:hypothetical protein